MQARSYNGASEKKSTVVIDAVTRRLSF